MRQIGGFDAHLIRSVGEIPAGITRHDVARFFNETMRPYQDEVPDVERALDYALVPGLGQGGFLALLADGAAIAGCLCMLRTGMSGYIPPNILLFVSIAPEHRGGGVGRQLIEFALEQCEGDVKLHVEYENPAKRLYERMGFATKYAEMRLKRS